MQIYHFRDLTNVHFTAIFSCYAQAMVWLWNFQHRVSLFGKCVQSRLFPSLKHCMLLLVRFHCWSACPVWLPALSRRNWEKKMINWHFVLGNRSPHFCRNCSPESTNSPTQRTGCNWYFVILFTCILFFFFFNIYTLL